MQIALEKDLINLEEIADAETVKVKEKVDDLAIMKEAVDH